MHESSRIAALIARAEPPRAKGARRGASAPTLDHLGAGAGLLCAIHCALVGLAPGLLALAGLGALLGGGVEWTLLATSLTLAASAAIVGFSRHRSRAVVLLFALACATLLAGRWFEAAGVVGSALAVAGGVLVAAAHLINLKTGRAHAACGRA